MYTRLEKKTLNEKSIIFDPIRIDFGLFFLKLQVQPGSDHFFYPSRRKLFGSDREKNGVGRTGSSRF